MAITRTPFDDSEWDDAAVGVRYDYLEEDYGLWARTYVSEPDRLGVVGMTQPPSLFEFIPYEDDRFCRAVRSLVRDSGAREVVVLVDAGEATGYRSVDLARVFGSQRRDIQRH